MVAFLGPYRNPEAAPASWFGRTVHATAMSTNGLTSAREQNMRNHQVKRHLDELWREAFVAGAAFNESMRPSIRFMVVTEEEKAMMLASTLADHIEDKISAATAVPTPDAEKAAAYAEHSMILNEIGFKLARALRLMEDNDTAVNIDIRRVVDEVISELDRLNARCERLDTAIVNAIDDLIEPPRPATADPKDPCDIGHELRAALHGGPS